MTILGPLLIAAVYGFTLWLALNDESSDTVKKIIVIDEKNILNQSLKNTKSVVFQNSEKKIEEEKRELKDSDNYGILFLPDNFSVDNPEAIQFFTLSQPSIVVVENIEKQIKTIIESSKLELTGINKDILDKVKTDININTIQITKDGEVESSAGAALTIGMIASILIYITIFIYGVQVMRGVIEEKTSRIIEVLVSSVKPFQLMLGKILGIAAVGLTQFILWIILSTVTTQAISSFYFKGKVTDKLETLSNSNEAMKEVDINNPQQLDKIKNALSSINFPLVITMFVFYFLGGYLLYSALFAAIGSAVDSEAETQQFMLPVTIPLIIAFMMVQFIVKSPEGPVAFWFSIIPLTSPVVMMVRIPFGVPAWEIILSAVLLILGFVFTVWMASKIFRVGILMWGKKVNFKELYKWFFY